MFCLHTLSVFTCALLTAAGCSLFIISAVARALLFTISAVARAALLSVVAPCMLLFTNICCCACAFVYGLNSFEIAVAIWPFCGACDFVYFPRALLFTLLAASAVARARFSSIASQECLSFQVVVLVGGSDSFSAFLSVTKSLVR
jgi:hypothetical protein